VYNRFQNLSIDVLTTGANRNLELVVIVLGVYDSVKRVCLDIKQELE